MIVARGLTKIFGKKGSRQARRFSRHGGRPKETIAVDGVDLEIPRGSVFGLIGPNGAGKTTLIKLLATLIIPDAGHATVNSYDIRRQEREVRASIGLSIGGERSFYWRLTGRQNLEFFGVMQGLKGREQGRAVDQVLARLELTEKADVPFRDYSLGMKRKLDVARALLTDPAVFLFDEPTSSIDPYAAIKIREIITDLKERGKTILLVTHNLPEAERLCDAIGVMNRGRLVAMGDAASLRGLSQVLKIRVRLSDRQADGLLPTLAGLPGVKRVEANGTEVTILADHQDGVVNRVVRALAATNVVVGSINVDWPSLEDVFIYLTEDGHHGPGHRLR